MWSARPARRPLRGGLAAGLSLIAIVAGEACSNGKPRPDPAAPVVHADAQLTNDAPSPTAPAAKPAPPSLVAGGSGGIAVIGADGKVTRRLSATPTSHPRWTADHQALVFLSESGELRRLDLATGAETTIGKLPATIAPCAGKTIDRTTLAIQSDEDFAFEPGGRAICIRLQDRNINMADVIIAFRVDLATGAAVSTIEMSACERDGGEMPEGCRGRLPAGPAAQKSAQRPFAISEGVLTHGKSHRNLGRPHDYNEEKVSPSGKWAIVGGNHSNGDYIERDLFLFDRDTGQLYPLPESATTWPAPVPSREQSKLASWSGRTISAVGETPILWLGDRDAVAIGHALVVPGISITPFEGDLAR